MNDSEQRNWDQSSPDEREDRPPSEPDSSESEGQLPPSPDDSSHQESEDTIYEYYSPEAGAHYTGPGASPGHEEEEPDFAMPSWERRAELGFAEALVRSIPEILFHPVQTFRSMPVIGGVAGPLLFVVLLGTVGSIFQTFYSILGISLDMVLPETEYVSEHGGAIVGEMDARADVMFEIVAMVLSPIIVAVFAFISSGIIHIFLMLFGGARRGFEATFRVMAYVGGATALFSLVPLCGAWIALVWGVVCEIIGLCEAHRTDTWRAVLAFAAPLFLCCCLFAAMGFFFGFALSAVQNPELIESLR